MFAEDVRQFFDPRDFGVQAVIRRPDGSTLRTANVIVGTPTQEPQIFGDGRVTTPSPRAAGATADLGDVARDYTLTVGTTAYVVTAPPDDDGTGVSTLKLRKR